MRKFKRQTINDLSEGDIVALPVSHEDGTMHNYIGVISLVRLSEDKTEREYVKFIPMAETSRITHKYNTSTYDITDPNTLKLTGLDTEHTALGIEIQFKPVDLLDNPVWYLGFLKQEFFEIIDMIEDQDNPNIQKLKPKILECLQLPEVEVVEYIPKELGQKLSTEEFTTQAGSSPGALDIMDTSKDTGLVTDLPELGM